MCVCVYVHIERRREIREHDPFLTPLVTQKSPPVAKISCTTLGYTSVAAVVDAGQNPPAARRLDVPSRRESQPRTCARDRSHESKKG